MSGAHTKGPWVAEPGGGRGAWIKGATGEWAALACGDDDATADANARLIAAAPQMFEALRDTLRMLEAAHRQLGMHSADNKRVIAARAALAAAGGEG